ncbi:MAG TPA: hypothetical protein VMZ52_02205 [Bryobacteraceae bacterium]|nr:hypothetical protein [Bryobacteraceae bacterium]
MDKHVQLAGILHIIFGAVGLIAALTLVIASGGFGGVQTAFGDDTVGMAALIMVIFQLVVCIPCMVGGWGLMRYQDWARVMLTVVAGVNMLNVPIGSALGAYGLWVLTSQETEPLFAHPPRRGSKNRPALKKSAVPPEESSQKTSSVLPSDT